MLRLLLALAVTAAALAAVPAEAGDVHHPRFNHHHHGFHHGFRRPPASVFPVPHDPWRSWGVRSELPRRVGPPPAVIVAPTPVPAPVWVPGRWFWDGATWVWWPGRWIH